MANAIKYSARGTFTANILGTASTPTAKNLSNNAQKLGQAIDLTGSGSRQQEANFQLACRGASAFSAGGYVALYLITSVNSQYEDGDDSVAPPASAWVGNFPLRAVSTQQYVNLEAIPIPNCPFKPMIINKGGQNFTNTDGENTLGYEAYDPNEVQ